MQEVISIFPTSYLFISKCINFKEIYDLVYSYKDDDIDNSDFSWGVNCDVDKISISDREFYPLISKNIQAFANNIGLILKTEIHSPWINLYKRGQYQEIHDHSDHDFAGTIFMNNDIDFAKFYFFDRNSHRSPDIIKNAFNLHNSFYPPIEQGTILIFPGHMLHGVSQHKSDKVRKTLSFNFDVLDGKHCS